MPSGIYERTEYHCENMSKAKKGRTIGDLGHKVKVCQCCVCKAIRGESHRIDCQCPFCKAKRGEYRDRNHPSFGRKRLDVSMRNKENNPMKDSECVRKWMKARGVKPNKVEQRLDDILQQILPNEYKYVGDGEVILAGKCPDFININGQKKIIELFGDYWHKGDDGKKRVALFVQYGYQTLIIWEHELENKKNLRDRILDFHNSC